MLELIFSTWWHWFIAAILLMILEILVPGIFLIWLGLGAALTGLFLLLIPGAGLAWQLLALACSICIAVAAGLKWQRKLLRRQPAQLNLGLDGFIGRIAEVSQPFAQGHGRIRLDGSSYPATSKTPELAAGHLVQVTATRANLLVVEPAE
ncbi:MAG: NfeD family protein [Thiopseudomonas sp.]